MTSKTTEGMKTMNPTKCFELKLNNLHYTASLSDKCRDGHRYVTISVANHADASVTMALDVFRLMLDAINREGLKHYEQPRLSLAINGDGTVAS